MHTQNLFAWSDCKAACSAMLGKRHTVQSQLYIGVSPLLCLSTTACAKLSLHACPAVLHTHTLAHDSEACQVSQSSHTKVDSKLAGRIQKEHSATTERCQTALKQDLHASCFACFDAIGCIFKDQAGAGVRVGLKALGSVQEDVGRRLAILYHVTCTS